MPVDFRSLKHTISRVGNGTSDLSILCVSTFFCALQVREYAPKVPTIAIEYVQMVSIHSEKNIKTLQLQLPLIFLGTWSGASDLSRERKEHFLGFRSQNTFHDRSHIFF